MVEMWRCEGAEVWRAELKESRVLVLITSTVTWQGSVRGSVQCLGRPRQHQSHESTRRKSTAKEHDILQSKAYENTGILILPPSV